MLKVILVNNGLKSVSGLYSYGDVHIFLKLVEPLKVGLYFDVQLLNMLLIYAHYALFALNIVHGNIIIFVYVFQLFRNPLLFLFELSLPLEQLDWLLLELGEDH